MVFSCKKHLRAPATPTTEYKIKNIRIFMHSSLLVFLESLNALNNVERANVWKLFSTLESTDWKTNYIVEFNFIHSLDLVTRAQRSTQWYPVTITRKHRKHVLTSSDSVRSMLPFSSSSSCWCSDLIASIPRRSCISAHSMSSAKHAPSADPLPPALPDEYEKKHSN